MTDVVDLTAAEENPKRTAAAVQEATANHRAVKSRAQEARFVGLAVKLAFKKGK